VSGRIWQFAHTSAHTKGDVQDRLEGPTVSGPVSVDALPGLGDPTNSVKGSKISMSQVTELASGQINAVDTLVIELVEANETPAVVIVRWPSMPSVLHPRVFPATADTAARTFAAAVVRLAQLRRDRKL
jgi:hypothetical protein